MDSQLTLPKYKVVYNQYTKVDALLKKDFLFYLEINEILSEKIFNFAANKNEVNYFEEIKNKVFNETFCQEKNLEKIKNNFLRAYFDIDTTRKTSNPLNLFNELAKICWDISKITQKHWEFFQYKRDKLVLSDVLDLFLKKINEVVALWKIFSNKFEIYSRILITNQNLAPNKELVRVFYKKADNGSELLSFKNFITLIEEIANLIALLKGEVDAQLKISSSQIQANYSSLNLLLPIENVQIFKKFMLTLHPNILQKDGLQKLLIQIFGAEKIRNVEKKSILSKQKKIKDLITKIQKNSDFEAETVFSQEMYQILHKFLNESNRLKNKENNQSIANDLSQDSPTTIKTNNSITTPNTTTSANTNASSSKVDINKKEHLAFLTSK